MFLMVNLARKPFIPHGSTKWARSSITSPCFTHEPSPTHALSSLWADIVEYFAICCTVCSLIKSVAYADYIKLEDRESMDRESSK